MWEKSLFIIYGHISIFSCLWGTFGEEIKKKKKHTDEGKNEFRCQDTTLKEQTEKNIQSLCLPLWI